MKYSRSRLLDSYLNKQAVWYWPPSWGEDDSPFSSGRATTGTGSSSGSKSSGGSPGGGGGNPGPSEPVPGGSSSSSTEEEPKKKKGKMNKLMKMMLMAQLMNGGGHASPMFTPFGYPVYGGGGGGGVNPMMLMMLANMSSKKSKSKAKAKLSPSERVRAFVASRTPIPVATPVATATPTPSTSTSTAPAPATMYSEADLERRKEEIRRRVAADKAIEDNADQIINEDIQRREINRRKWKHYRLMKSPIYAASMLTGAHAGYKWLGDALFGNPETRRYAGDGSLGNLIWTPEPSSGSGADKKDPKKRSWGEFIGRNILGIGGLYLGARAARLGTSYFEPEDLSTAPLPIR